MDKFFLSLIIFGFLMILFVFIKEYVKPIQSLSIDENSKSIVKLDLDKEFKHYLKNGVFEDNNYVTQTDLKKITIF